MTWWAIEVAPGNVAPDAVARRLAELTGQAVEERSAALVVGFVDEQARAEAIGAGLRRAFDGSLTVRVAAAPSVDWSVRWRDGMRLRSIGELTVGPSWLLEPGPKHLVVDPEMAFGSGEHGSTRGAVALLARHLAPGALVLDVGSGSGILSIAAVLLGAQRAIGLEIDADAEPVAAENARRNRVGDRVHFLTGDARNLLPLLGPVDLVVANILRSANVELLPYVVAALRPGGVAVFAGMEASERDMFLGPLAGARLIAIEEVEDDGWWAVAARQP